MEVFPSFSNKQAFLPDVASAGIRFAQPRIRSWLVPPSMIGRYTKVLPSLVGVFTLRQSSGSFMPQVSASLPQEVISCLNPYTG